MGRRHRHYISGGIYHIIQRGHNRSYIFNQPVDKAHFLSLIRKTKNVLPFHVLYYVLMDNHYHLIVEMLDVPIEKAMHHLNLAYSRYYLKKYQCTGTVYGERYRAYAVSDTPYLLKLIRYIAYNPVKAGIVKRPTDYRWSAHKEIVAQRNGTVAAHRLLKVVGGNLIEGSEAYIALIKLNERTAPLAPTHDAFLKERRIEKLTELLHERISDRAAVQLLRIGSRDSISNRYRHDFIHLAIKNGYKCAELACFLNVTTRSVRKYISVPGPNPELVDLEA